MGRWTSGVAASTNASRIAQAKKYSRLACDERVRQAKQAAYERAAKVAENKYAETTLGITAGQAIAADIRALAENPAEETEEQSDG